MDHRRSMKRHAVKRLMRDYHRQFPDATEFNRGSYQYEISETLDALLVHYDLVERKEHHHAR